MIDQLVPAPPETRDDKININALCAHGFLGKNLQLSPKEAKPGLEQSANNI